jgi:hypothetical protein
MKLALLALYGGPDQIMGVASGVATIVGILLMLWNKILVTIGKAVNWINPARRKPDTVPPTGSQQAD